MQAAAIAANFPKDEAFFDFFINLLERAAVFGDDLLSKGFIAVPKRLDVWSLPPNNRSAIG